MRYEILNILTNDNGRWLFTGQIIDGTITTSISDTIPAHPTSGQLKRAIREKVESITTEPPQKTRTLSEDTVFKRILSRAVPFEA